MRLTRLAILPFAAVLAVGACSAAESPGWTYAPAPPATPTPEPGGSGAPSAAPSGEPTGAPSGAPGLTLELVASQITYDKLELTVPAGEPFAIHLVNEDPPGVPHDVDIETSAGTVLAGEPFAIHLVNEDPAGVPHDVDIETSDGTVLQNMDTVDGGQEVTYTYEPLDAGEYVFQCSIHPIPNMTGKLIVE